MENDNKTTEFDEEIHKNTPEEDTEDEEIASITKAILSANTKIFVKQMIFAICCIIFAVIGGSIKYHTAATVVIPLLVLIFPIGLTAFYLYLFKKNRIGYAYAHIVEDKRDVVGGIISGVSLTHKKYFFETQLPNGEIKTFSISRGGIFNNFRVGQAYLIVYNNTREPGSDNFIECVPVNRRG